MIKAILFDLDETLVMEEGPVEESFFETALLVESRYGLDPLKFARLAREKAREQWHLLPSFDYARRMAISSWEALWARFDGNQEGIHQLRKLAAKYRYDSWTSALRDSGIEDMNLAEELAERYTEIRRKKHILFPEVLNVFRKLYRSYTLGIISNGIPDVQREKISYTGIAAYIDLIVISVEAGVAKPEPEIFMIALKQLGIKNDEAVMVGNSLKRDIAGARNAGIISVWVNRNEIIPEKDDLPDYLLKDLNGLTGVLEELKG